MILLFLLLSYLSKASTTPISSPSLFNNILSPPGVSLRAPNEADAGCTCPDQRSIWDIIWACLVTVFACSWVSVHPDIPAPRENWRQSALRRLEYMLWTILTPELTIYWAVRQWKGAHKIARDQRGWTYTHGHFLQMGGFVLYNGTEPRGVISYDRYTELLKNGRIECPKITKEEIDDRSKSDGLSKALVITQTGWFVLQCIARRARGLPITELELSTLAFAALNSLMYYFWWDKPFDVRSTVPVMLLPVRQSDSDDPAGRLRSTSEYTSTEPIDVGTPPSMWKGHHSWTSVVLSALHTIYKFFTSRLSAIIEHHDGEFSDFEDLKGEDDITPMRVPTFYAYMFKADEDDYFALLFALPFIGTTFGAIHCAGWFFEFPSTVELQIWRICSVYITTSPIAIFTLGVISGGVDAYDIDSGCLLFAHKLSSLLFSTGASLYVVARLLLLAESFTTLRNLPPEAYDVVKWTSFIPHI